MAKKYLAVKNKVLKGGKHYISLDYGYTYKDGSFHKGIDLLASDEPGKGADYIVAYDDGVVTGYMNAFAGTTTDTGTPGMGNYVIIDHGNGYKTRYMHMLKGSVKVKTGDKVKKGQVIGYMGNTGNSHGRHLHFDISYNKKISNSYLSGGRYYLDPKPFLKGDNEKSEGKTPVKESVSTNAYTVKVNTVLNVRREPSINSRILGVLKNGTKVTKIGEKGDWTEIQVSSIPSGKGWVMTRYIKKA